jgi:O-methyltransferase
MIKKIIKNLLSLFKLKLVKISNEQEFPIETEEEIKNFINLSNQFSMTGKRRMFLLTQAILNVKNNNLEGDFVECGVWKGGNILLYNLLNEFYRLEKTIFAYDTFDGMPSPENIDITHYGTPAEFLMKESEKKNGKNDIHCFASLNLVKKNILKYSTLNNIKFIKEKVEETLSLEKNLPNKISILRLDTDFYSSTKKELEILYPRLVSGGVLIIDDYGFWKGARKAVDEYFDKQKWLHVVDRTCRYLIKD